MLVEFEDASRASLFRAGRGRRVSHWESRVEAGVSQVSDWLFRLDSARNSHELERDCGGRQVRPLGLVLAGRRSEVSPYDRVRLHWRSEHTVIGGSKLIILTYDDLLEWLDGRLSLVRSLEDEVEAQRGVRRAFPDPQVYKAQSQPLRTSVVPGVDLTIAAPDGQLGLC